MPRVNSLIVLAVIILDQITKLVAVNFFPSQVKENAGLPFLGIDLPGFSDLWLVLVIFLIFTFLYRHHLENPQTKTGVSFIIGGGVSNLAERIVRGSVRDFINLGMGNTFNLADVAIMIGIGLLLISNLKASALGGSKT